MKRKAFVYTFSYLLLLVFLRVIGGVRGGGFRVFGELWVLLGGVLGAWILDKEGRLMVFLGHPSAKPVLRNALCQSALLALAFFIGTSSVSLFPLSFVLGVLTRSLLEQYLEIRGIDGLNSWFWFVGGKLSLKVQKLYLASLALFVLWISLMVVSKQF